MRNAHPPTTSRVPRGFGFASALAACALLAAATVMAAPQDGAGNRELTNRGQDRQSQTGDRESQRGQDRGRDRDRGQAVQRGAPEGAEMPLRGMHVAVMVAEGLHDLETLVPMGYLANRGARVTVIGVEVGPASAYNSDIEVMVQHHVARVQPERFDALVLPGGQGPAVLRENEDAVNFAKKFFESGKPVAAICHGPQVLMTAGVLEGKTATCIADISSELREYGADYKDEPVVRDGNLITSRVPDDIPAFVIAIEEMMVEKAGERRREPRRPPGGGRLGGERGGGR